MNLSDPLIVNVIDSIQMDRAESNCLPEPPFIRSSPAKNFPDDNADVIVTPSLCHSESKSAITSSIFSCASPVASISALVVSAIVTGTDIGVSEKLSWVLNPTATATKPTLSVSFSPFTVPDADGYREPTISAQLNDGMALRLDTIKCSSSFSISTT